MYEYVDLTLRYHFYLIKVYVFDSELMDMDFALSCEVYDCGSYD